MRTMGTWLLQIDAIGVVRWTEDDFARVFQNVEWTDMRMHGDMNVAIGIVRIFVVAHYAEDMYVVAYEPAAKMAALWYACRVAFSNELYLQGVYSWPAEIVLGRSEDQYPYGQDFRLELPKVVQTVEYEIIAAVIDEPRCLILNVECN
nr:hypothetical protein CFP56_53386 [Quercus suber]